MTKFPLLEQLRNDYRTKETEIAKPIYNRLNQVERYAESLRRTIGSLERTVGNKVFDYVLEDVAHDLSNHMRRAVLEATCSKAHPDVILVPLGPEFKFMLPEALEAQILKSYATLALPAVRLGVEEMREDKATVVIFELPNVSIKRTVMENN